MASICTLAPDINQCPHYNRETQTCNVVGRRDRHLAVIIPYHI